MASFIFTIGQSRAYIEPKAKKSNAVQGNDPKRPRPRVKAMLMAAMPVDQCHSLFKSAWINEFSWLKYDSAAKTEDVLFTVASIVTSQNGNCRHVHPPYSPAISMNCSMEITIASRWVRICIRWYHRFFPLRLQPQCSARLSRSTTSKKTVTIPADCAVQPDLPTAMDSNWKSYWKSTLATLKLLRENRDKLSLS